MKKISLKDFSPVQGQKNILYLRQEDRICSTRYILKDEKSGKLLMIDAGDGRDELDFTPDCTLLTHEHWDHTAGVKPEWKEVYIHKNADASLAHTSIPKQAKRLLDGEFIFHSFKLQITNTPGHTAGSSVIFEPKSGILFSGDTKFAEEGYGRTDLGGSDEQMQKSLALVGKIPYKLLCAGHGEFEEK